MCIIALLFAFTDDALADGCKFAPNGRVVPEREQRALIEWADGVETLHVAALSDPTTSGSVWIVPVRAVATSVRAEPVDEFPAVTYYRPHREQALQRIREAEQLVGLLDSGGLCCPLFVSGCGGAAGDRTGQEVARVEKLGMVVTVVSAESRGELERYLETQRVNHAQADLTSLDSYLGHPEYAFVCGWVAPGGVPTKATGLKIVFPSPTLWFPLLPTRIYDEPVETVVFVKGHVRPVTGCTLPDLRCDYGWGLVERRGVGQAFRYESGGWYGSGGRKAIEPVTRVTLTTRAKDWDRDLELEPGMTWAGSVVWGLGGWVAFFGPLWSGLLGTLIGLMIPWVTVPRAERRRSDWFVGGLIGASITGTIWLSAVVFSIWRWHRFGNRAGRPSYLAVPALAIVHYCVARLVCYALIVWLTADAS